MSEHRCRKVCLRCALFTIGFPVEHLMWEKLPVLRQLTVLLGL